MAFSVVKNVTIKPPPPKKWVGVEGLGLKVMGDEERRLLGWFRDLPPCDHDPAPLHRQLQHNQETRRCVYGEARIPAGCSQPMTECCKDTKYQTSRVLGDGDFPSPWRAQGLHGSLAEPSSSDCSDPGCSRQTSPLYVAFGQSQAHITVWWLPSSSAFLSTFSQTNVSFTKILSHLTPFWRFSGDLNNTLSQFTTDLDSPCPEFPALC